MPSGWPTASRRSKCRRYREANLRTPDRARVEEVETALVYGQSPSWWVRRLSPHSEIMAVDLGQRRGAGRARSSSARLVTMRFYGAVTSRNRSENTSSLGQHVAGFGVGAISTSA